MESLNEIINDSLQKYLDHLSRVANKIHMSGLSAEEQEAFLDKSKKVIGECCAMDLEHERDLELLRKTEENFTKNDNGLTPEEIFQDLKKKQPKISKDFEQHDIYTNMIDIINETRQRAGLGGVENRRADDDGEDGLMVFDVQISTMDPITMKEMTDPVKSSLCGHAYEKSSMLEILKFKPRTKCPHMGCNQYVSKSDLVPDHQMKRCIERRRDQD